MDSSNVNGLINSNVDFITISTVCQIPRLTTAQKNVLQPSNGMIVYDTTLNVFQCFQSGSWTTIISGSYPTGILHSNGTSIFSALIDNVDVSNTAAIAYSKLNLNNSITNNDLVGNIVYSKLTPNPVSINTPNTLVLRNSGGGFSCGAININGTITGNNTYTQTRLPPTDNSWGARIIVRNNALTTGKSFNIGIYRFNTTEACYIGANDGTAATSWEDCFINPNGGFGGVGNVFIGFTPTTGPAFRSEKVNVLGGLYSDSGIRIGSGSLTGSGGSINLTGAITYDDTVNRFVLNENTIQKRIPNTRYASINSGGVIDSLVGNYGITSTSRISAGNYLVNYVDWQAGGIPFIQVAANGAGSASIFSSGNSSCQIRTFNTAGVVADLAFTIIIIS